MVILKYKGTHQPKGMLIEVAESKVKKLIESGEYESLTLTKPTKPIVNSKEVEDNDSNIRRS